MHGDEFNPETSAAGGKRVATTRRGDHHLYSMNSEAPLIGSSALASDLIGAEGKSLTIPNSLFSKKFPT